MQSREHSSKFFSQTSSSFGLNGSKIQKEILFVMFCERKNENMSVNLRRFVATK